MSTSRLNTKAIEQAINHDRIKAGLADIFEQIAALPKPVIWIAATRAVHDLRSINLRTDPSTLAMVINKHTKMNMQVPFIADLPSLNTVEHEILKKMTRGLKAK